MNCPKCGKEMEQGYLYSPHRQVPIIYGPQNIKYPSFKIYAKPGDYRDLGLLDIESGTKETIANVRRHRVIAYICKECRTGVFEYDEDKTVSTERP